MTAELIELLTRIADAMEALAEVAVGSASTPKKRKAATPAVAQAPVAQAPVAQAPVAQAPVTLAQAVAPLVQALPPAPVAQAPAPEILLDTPLLEITTEEASNQVRNVLKAMPAELGQKCLQAFKETLAQRGFKSISEIPVAELPGFVRYILALFNGLSGQAPAVAAVEDPFAL